MTNDDMKLKWDLYVRRVRNTGWDDLLEKGMRSVQVVGKAVVNPTPFNVIEALLSVARTMTASDLYFYDVLDRKGWKRIFPTCIKDQLLEILEPHVTSKVDVNSAGDTVVMLISKPGVRIAWVKDTEENTTTDILAHIDDYNASAEFVRNILWSTINPNRLVLNSATKNFKMSPDSKKSQGQVRIDTDDLIESMNSKAADEWTAYLKRCIEINITRTILFHGKPGSGKSTLARTICDKLGIRSLRIRVEDVAFLDTDTVGEIISIFEPDAIIFDDLDRSTSQLALLEIMEMLHRRVKFVFATVNHLTSLVDALKRPGRFDEIVCISKLDYEAIVKLLGTEAADVFDLVKDWPVAFVKEYMIRRKIVGADKALESVKELQTRVAELMESYSGDAPQQAGQNTSEDDLDE